jgi:hypothetical protein
MKRFLETKAKVAEHNIRFSFGLETYKMGINQFSDKVHWG